MNNVIRTVGRKGIVRQSAPQRHTAVRRAAEALSLRAVDQATTELLNEALAAMTKLCYERDGTGHLCNVDEATGRLLTPCPWGKKGYSLWGLRAMEGNVLRRILFNRQREGISLFEYDPSRRAWYLDMTYLEGTVPGEWEITIREYRRAHIELLEHERRTR